MNIFIANSIHYFHYILVIYILIGYIITPIKYLKYYIYLLIIIFLNWNDINGQCILTRLEYYFRTDKWNQDSAIKENAPEFFRPMINKLLNINLNRLEADRLNNFVFMLCLLFGFIRYDYFMC